VILEATHEGALRVASIHELQGSRLQ
jgi:hypothetical protein